MLRVVLDPGHGGTDPGAVGDHGLLEKDVVLAVALICKEVFAQDPAVECILTRDTDTFITLSNRTKIANGANADVFVSIHCNGFHKSTARGFESFRLSGNPATGPSGRLQEALHKRLAALFTGMGSPDRGVKEASFQVLRQTQAPAVLLELGFVTNPYDAVLLRDSRFLDRLAWAICSGIRAYANWLTSRPTPRPAPPPDPTPLKTITSPATGVLYRVIVDAKQTGAYSNPAGLAREVQKAVEAGASKITIEKV